MSFQAYLDNVEKQTGMTPNDFITAAKEKGLHDPSVKPGQIISWLKQEYGIGHGHAMALTHVIQKGPKISEKHVGSDGVHRDESVILRLDGINNR